MHGIRALVLSLTVAVVIAGCNETATGPDLSGEPITYRDGAREQTGELFTVSVPADPSSPGADSIELTYVVLPALGEPDGAPIIHLAGGPGDRVIDAVRGDFFDWVLTLREAGDVVLFDQRGVGRSQPGTTCGRRFSLSDGQTLDSLTAEITDQYAGCVDEVEARGVSLSDYTTRASVADIEAIRVDMGRSEVILDGQSYGTHLALAYIRAHGDRVARAILRGTEGPDHTLKLPANVEAQLSAVGDVVAADAAAGAVLPDLPAYVRGIIDSADAAPIRAPFDGDTVTLNGDALRVAIANLLGDRDDIQALVYGLAASVDGDWSVLAAAMAAIQELEMPAVMTIAMDCASGATAARTLQIATEAESATLGDAINFPFPAVCSAVGDPDLGDAFRAPVTTDVPTLFISGTLDGRTPVSNAEEVGQGFTRASHLVINGAGHTALDTEAPGLAAQVLRFLAGEPLGTTELDMPPIDLVLP